VAEYANKATAVFITSTGEYPGTNRMEYIGTKGKVIIEEGILKFYSLESDEREIRFTTDAASPNIDVYYEEFKQTEPESGHIGILQNFTDAILYNKDLLAPGYEGINGLTISNAAYMSDWLDSWIDLPLDEELYRRLLKEKQEKEVTIKKQAFKENLNGKYNERWQVRW
jgi:predicted dehydrogenase